MKKVNVKRITNYNKLRLPTSSGVIDKTNSSKIDYRIFKEYKCGSDAYYLTKINEYDFF